MRYIDIELSIGNLVQDGRDWAHCNTEDGYYEHTGIQTEEGGHYGVQFLIEDHKFARQYKKLSLEELGAGSFGRVKKVEDKALKIINGKKTSILYACREVAAMLECKHDNVICYYSHWMEFYSTNKSSFYYIMMELCNFSLRTWMRIRNEGKNPLSIDHIDCQENRNVLNSVICGVAHIHKIGWIHRDLNSDNIMVNVDEPGKVATVKIGDFGISRKLCDLGDSTYGSEELSGCLGSTPYSAPEQLEGTEYTEKVDMYSIGVLIYALYHPCPDDNILEELEYYPVPDNFSNNWEFETDLIDQLTAVDSDERPSAEELLRMIDEQEVDSREAERREAERREAERREAELRDAKRHEADLEDLPLNTLNISKFSRE